ncbi:MAG: hypothetical protein ABJG68_05040 [Crocinitomicaceae bacterium]
MKRLIVLLALMAPCLWTFSEMKNQSETSTQTSLNASGIGISNASASTDQLNHENQNSMLLYIIPGALILLTVLSSIAICKRLFLES